MKNHKAMIIRSVEYRSGSDDLLHAMQTFHKLSTLSVHFKVTFYSNCG